MTQVRDNLLSSLEAAKQEHRIPKAEQIRAEIESLEARLKMLKRVLKAVEGEEKPK